MPSYTPCPSNPNRHTRPLGENETYIKLIGDSTHSLNREYWSIHSWATLKPQGTLNCSLLVAQLRKAWAHLRFQHPSIAAYVSDTGKDIVYDVPNAEALEQWLEESFRVDEEADGWEDVVKQEGVPKYWNLTFVEKSCDVVCRTSHWRSDGIGVVQLLNALFKIAVQPGLCEPRKLAWGEEVERLAPSIEDIASIPNIEDLSDEQKAVGQKSLETFGLTAGAVGIPYLGDGETLPAGTVIARATFSDDETQSVIKKCKEKDMSVTAAVHASVAATNWHFTEPSRKTQHYTSTARFSFKPWVPKPYESPESATSLLTTGWMVKAEPAGTWDQHARMYTSIYRAGLSKDFINAYRVYAGALCDVLRNPPAAPKGTPPPSDVDISSIGKLSQHVQERYGSPDYGLEVLDIGEGVEILSRQAVVFVWTFRGKLTLSLVYNEAFHTAEQMQDFVSSVKKSVLSELGI